nr:uncharacterized protein LOC109156357 [Ipomoea batatas]
MGNSLRCCLACVIPCGALDLIRIVHLNGQVEEIAHPITAGEVLNNNPNHVLSKPSSSQGMVRRIMILSPDSELKRGRKKLVLLEMRFPQNHSSAISRYQPADRSGATLDADKGRTQNLVKDGSHVHLLRLPHRWAWQEMGNSLRSVWLVVSCGSLRLDSVIVALNGQQLIRDGSPDHDSFRSLSSREADLLLDPGDFMSRTRREQSRECTTLISAARDVGVAVEKKSPCRGIAPER